MVKLLQSKRSGSGVLSAPPHDLTGVNCQMPDDTPSADWRVNVYRGGEGIGRRARPTKAIQEQILAEQDNRCFYCGATFGDVASRYGSLVAVKVAWDHALPFSYSQRNPEANWVAACSVCNSIKSNHVFDSIDDARRCIRERRIALGYAVSGKVKRSSINPPLIRGRFRDLPNDVIREITRRSGNGETASAIARATGASVGHVQRQIRRAGWWKQHHPNRTPPWE